MTMRAAWADIGQPSTEGDEEEDPFGNVAAAPGRPDEEPPPPADGPPSRFNLATPIEELDAEIGRLLKQEAQLFEMEVTCELKDKADMSCLVCPVSRVGQRHPLAPLCDLGRRQERIGSLAVAVRAGRGEKRGV